MNEIKFELAFTSGLPFVNIAQFSVEWHSLVLYGHSTVVGLIHMLGDSSGAKTICSLLITDLLIKSSPVNAVY